jgi:hypothetical protein
MTPSKRSTISLPLVKRNISYSKSSLRFIYQRPPEFKHHPPILPFQLWKEFQQSIDCITKQTTFWNQNLVMVFTIISLFGIIYLIKVMNRFLFCFINANVCMLIQPGVCSYGNNNDDCNNYQGWQMGYFITNLTLGFISLISIMRLRFSIMDIHIDSNSVLGIQNECVKYSNSLFVQYGYFVEYDVDTQNIVFRSVVCDGTGGGAGISTYVK